jgi:oligoendopeptidase F
MAVSVERVWDLTRIYPDVAEWEKDRKRVDDDLTALQEYRGRLSESSETLEAALTLLYELERRVRRLHTYASLSADEDLREPEPQALRQKVEGIIADFAARTSWIDPELLAIEQGTLSALRDRPAMAVYARFFDKLEKRRAHVLSAGEERVLGHARHVCGGGETVSTLLRNTEIPWPQVELHDGSTLQVDINGYSRARISPHREDRRVAFRAFFDCLQGFRNTLAATVHTTAKEHLFNARVRNYESCLDAALHENEVDTSVYHMLVHEVNEALPTLHRYLKLRQRILGIDELHYHDIYAPLVPEVSVTYEWEASRDLVLEAVAPLGDAYVSRLGEALRGRQVHVDPSPGKRSGAYVSDGAYGVCPYMLLNHQDDFHSLATLAHESGHLMHSWFSQQAQPFPTARYVIFVAEVASTFNEALLMHALLDRATSDQTRLALLGHELDALRGTVFRQAMFAEFELRFHEAIERGEALTGDILNELYLDLLHRYHGSERGVMAIDDRYASEWAFVPHFHYDFYVYQYATSYVAATALAQSVLAGSTEARDRYLRFLERGSEQPPVDLLRDAGVDMTGPEAFLATVRRAEEIMDGIEEILARRGS